MFYPDVKPHISPSALAAWHTQKSQFIKNYFEGVKIQETSAMTAGKKIHKLIEVGFLKPKLRFDLTEQELTAEVEGIKVLGFPDGYDVAGNMKESVVKFVDYKTGKNNGWDNSKLAVDLKMRTTAWLVWQNTALPHKVIGYVEYIPTKWDEETKEIIPDGETVIAAEYEYTAEELEKFTEVIANTIVEVNSEYPRYLESTGEFVSDEDTARYAELETIKNEIETEQKAIKDRLQQQMTVGGIKNYKTDSGTFFINERKSYEYPKNLKINYLDMGLMLDDVEKIDSAAKVAKKNWEKHNDPKSVSKSVTYRPKK